MKVLKSIIFGILVLAEIALVWGVVLLLSSIDICVLIATYSILVVVIFSYAYYKVNY